MTSAIYAVISAFILIWLTFKVIKQRHNHKVALGDGGHAELQNARGAHENAVDTIPIFLLLLFVLEYNGGPLLLVHGLGLAFIAGRLIHARGLLSADLKGRVLGMKLTLFPLIGVAVLNMFYLPYGKLFGIES